MNDIRLASVQFHHTPSDKRANMAKISEFIERAAARNVELIAFPEMCLTGYVHVRDLSRSEIEELAEPIPKGPATKKLLQYSKNHHMTIGGGLIERAEEGALYNSYVVTMPDGGWACHRKLHCFISKYMSSGDSYTVFSLPQGTNVGVLICYDNNHVENARITALMEAEILLAPHQTGGVKSPSPRCMGLIDPQLWEDRLQNPEPILDEFQGPKGRGWIMRWLPSRAHDNGMFLVFSNGVGVDSGEVRTGNAMILDPYGEIIVESKSVDDDMVVADLDASILETSSGRRWLRSRRPELYGPIIRPTGKEEPIRIVRQME